MMMIMMMMEMMMLTTYLCVMHESADPAEKSCVDELAGSL